MVDCFSTKYTGTPEFAVSRAARKPAMPPPITNAALVTWICFVSISSSEFARSTPACTNRFDLSVASFRSF